MRNKIKPLLSLAAIGLFLLFAIASDLLPQESTNVSVAIRDCEEKPPVSGTIHVDVLYTVNGIPRAGVNGEMFLVHQKVNPDTTCSYSLLARQMLAFTTNANGFFTYEGVPFLHDNSEDLYRIEIEMFAVTGTGRRPERQVKVGKYNDSNFQFTFDELTGL